MKNSIPKRLLTDMAAALLSFLLLCSSLPASAQNEKAIALAIDSSQWVFVPDQAIPTVGITRQLNGGFSATCTAGKLQVYLPYFGRADGGADVFSGKGPLDFNSTDFKLTKQQSKPGKWNISIRPKDYREVQSMNFTVFANGSASLEVSMTNRSAISFNGRMEPAK